MRDFFSKYKAALGLLVIILLGFWAYTLLFQAPEEVLEVEPEPVGEELFEVLIVLEGISLDGAIFSDPDFLTLQDFETQVSSGIAGRANPFAPTGGDTGGQVVEPSYVVVPISTSESFIDALTDPEESEDTGTTTPVTE